MKIKLWAWRCQICGFEWLVKFQFPKLRGKRIVQAPIIPEQCPSAKCRSREWNGKKKAGRPAKDREVAVNVAGEVVGT